MKTIIEKKIDKIERRRTIIFCQIIINPSKNNYLSYRTLYNKIHNLRIHAEGLWQILPPRFDPQCIYASIIINLVDSHPISSLFKRHRFRIETRPTHVLDTWWIVHFVRGARQNSPMNGLPRLRISFDMNGFRFN